MRRKRSIHSKNLKLFKKAVVSFISRVVPARHFSKKIDEDIEKVGDFIAKDPDDEYLKKRLGELSGTIKLL